MLSSNLLTTKTLCINMIWLIELIKKKGLVLMSRAKEEIVKKDGDRFVTGRKYLSFGEKKKAKNLSRPEKIRYKGEDDIIMDMPGYDESTDLDIYIAKRMLKDWSKEEKITKENILADLELNDLLEEFIEEAKKANRLTKEDLKNKGKQSKKED